MNALESCKKDRKAKTEALNHAYIELVTGDMLRNLPVKRN